MFTARRKRSHSPQEIEAAKNNIRNLMLVSCVKPKLFTSELVLYLATWSRGRQHEILNK